MTYNAIIEERKNEGFRASILEWPSCTAEGATWEEALAKLRETLRERLAAVEIVPIEIEPNEESHPWLSYAGVFKDDPLFAQVAEDIEAYRCELDRE